MPSVYDLKPAFQRLLRPIVRALVRAGMTPNHITLAALAGSLAVGVVLWQGTDRPLVLLLLPPWLFARMALNAMDGMAAREHGMTTRLGGALNEVGDVASDLALYLPLSQWRAELLWPAVAFGLGAAFTEFCGVLGATLGGGRRYEGPMGKSDRALWIGLLALVTAFAPAALAGWRWVLWIAAALTALTCWNRLRAALRQSEPRAAS
jgi:CDP-diacylglycerol--glycerol-3-phosphate 3-phosphatidyltransferase